MVKELVLVNSVLPLRLIFGYVFWLRATIYTERRLVQNVGIRICTSQNGCH